MSLYKKPSESCLLAELKGIPALKEKIECWYQIASYRYGLKIIWFLRRYIGCMYTVRRLYSFDSSSLPLRSRLLGIVYTRDEKEVSIFKTITVLIFAF